MFSFEHLGWIDTVVKATGLGLMAFGLLMLSAHTARALGRLGLNSLKAAHGPVRGAVLHVLYYTLLPAGLGALLVMYVHRVYPFHYLDEYSVSFVRPNYLWLLIGLPLLWYYSVGCLSGLGRTRMISAIALRTAVLTLIVFAVAEIQVVKSSDRLTVLYVVDQSLSVPEAQRKRMIEYVNDSITEQREHLDRAGVIVFGRNAAVEIPPFDDNVQVNTVESIIDPDYTDLSAAIKLAMGSFPEDAARRIVLVSDGNQNRGEVLEQIKLAADSGVGIDVVPIEYSYDREVLVERLAIPPEVRKGQPVDLRVVVNNLAPHPVKGRLRISQVIDGQPELLAEQKDVELEPGKNVFTVRQEINEPNFYTFEATFVPEDGADTMLQNNRATAFTDVAGAARILLIEDEDRRGEHKELITALRNENLEVTPKSTAQLFVGLGELQQYDAVILADVPRERFTKPQIEMLVRNTQDLGAGLIMLGGPNSFGAGGWANTELEKAMPVDFHIKAAKVVPKGALALLMHASEMGNGNHWQKEVAKAALEALGSQDYCGLIHWDFQNQDRWLWNHREGGMSKVGPNRQRMLGEISRMAPGDMMAFDPAMQMAFKSLSRLPNVAARHMIIISDGDPSPPVKATLNQLANSKITVTTVGIGTHGVPDRKTLQDIATATGGKYYDVKSPNALPQIYQREARRVARPLIHTNPNGFAVTLKYQTEITKGITALPPMTGYVMSTLKTNKLIEAPLVAPEPGEEKHNTVLAHWQYGLGKTVAFSSDAGMRWTAGWKGSDVYNKLFSQMVRWAMRPTGQTGKFSVATETENGQTKVIITALDENDEFKNFLTMGGTVISPDLKTQALQVEQVAPGRYEATYRSEEAGSYFVHISPGSDSEGRPYAPIRTGNNVAYSAEFRDQVADTGLLTMLAGVVPRGGAAGSMIDVNLFNLFDQRIPEIPPEYNPYRHDLAKATSSQDAWHWLMVIASVLFFADIFNRRVTVGVAWVAPLAQRAWSKLRGQQPAEQAPEYMERLRSRKAEATQRFESQKAALRFEPRPDDEAQDYAGAVEEVSGGPSAPAERARPASQTGGLTSGPQEEESYTDRLLKAKKKVWEERKDTGTS